MINTKIFKIALIVLGSIAVSGSMQAQSINLDLSSKKETTHAGMVEIRLHVSDLTSAEAGNQLVEKLKKGHNVQDVRLTNISGTNAEVAMTLPKEHFYAALQRSLILAEIEQVTFNGKLIPTKDLQATIKATKK